MRTTTLILRENEYTLPNTLDMSVTDFNDILHDITENSTSKKIDKYGKYACTFSMTHDTVERTFYSKRKGVNYTITGGIDKSLDLICNFNKRSNGITRLKDACRNSNTDTKWLSSIKQRFADILKDIKSDTKSRTMPTYYTGALKHRFAKIYMENALAMIVQLETAMLMCVIIGNVEYEFEFTTEDNSKSGMSKAHHSVTSLSLSENDDDDLFDFEDEGELVIPEETIIEETIAVESTCALSYDVKQEDVKNVSHDDLAEVLASLDVELDNTEELKTQKRRAVGQ
jgi:hypothetical protein